MKKNDMMRFKDLVLAHKRQVTGDNLTICSKVEARLDDHVIFK